MSDAFGGFPQRGAFVAVPDAFFTELLPRLDDPIELKTALCLLRLLYRKRGYPCLVTADEVLADPALAASLTAHGGAIAEAARRGLSAAVAHGIVIHLTLERDGHRHDVYMLNREAERLAVERIRSGELHLGRLAEPEPAEPREQLNIFVLYERNIGVLTPLIADELREAERLYPAAWIEDAFREAVDLNKRSWRYISRILERWAREGRSDGKSGRHTRPIDPDKYIKGRYGHVTRR